MRALLTYKARLVDGQGKVLGVAASTANSKIDAVDRNGINLTVASAVETMYEDLAQKLLVSP